MSKDDDLLSPPPAFTATASFASDAMDTCGVHWKPVKEMTHSEHSFSSARKRMVIMNGDGRRRKKKDEDKQFLPTPLSSLEGGKDLSPLLKAADMLLGED